MRVLRPRGWKTSSLWKRFLFFHQLFFFVFSLLPLARLRLSHTFPPHFLQVQSELANAYAQVSEALPGRGCVERVHHSHHAAVACEKEI